MIASPSRFVNRPHRDPPANPDGHPTLSEIGFGMAGCSFPPAGMEKGPSQWAALLESMEQSVCGVTLDEKLDEENDKKVRRIIDIEEPL